MKKVIAQHDSPNYKFKGQKNLHEGSASISKLRRAVKNSKKLDFHKHWDTESRIHKHKEEGNKRFEKNASSYKADPSVKIFGGSSGTKKHRRETIGQAETKHNDSPKERYIRQESLKKKLKGSK